MPPTSFRRKPESMNIKYLWAPTSNGVTISVNYTKSSQVKTFNLPNNVFFPLAAF